MVSSTNRQKFKVSQMQKWNEEEGRNPGAFHNVGFDHNEGIGNLCGAQTRNDA